MIIKNSVSFHKDSIPTRNDVLLSALDKQYLPRTHGIFLYGLADVLAALGNGFLRKTHTVLPDACL